MTRTPIIVELPVCEACGHVSKIPAGPLSGKGYCTGPKGAQHKRTKMVPRQFAEVLPAAKAEAA